MDRPSNLTSKIKIKITYKAETQEVKYQMKITSINLMITKMIFLHKINISFRI